MRRRFIVSALALAVAGGVGHAQGAEAQVQPVETQPAPALSALNPSAISQSAQTRPTEPDIVVTGKVNAKPEEVQRQANAITNTSVKYRNPLAMFQDRVCPGILGMPSAMAQIMVDRIRRNAEQVGLKTAPLGDCQPNILVIFVRNGQGAIKELRNRQGHIFKDIPLAELQEMAADSGPVHAWVNTIVRSRQGDALQGDNSADLTRIPTLNVAQSQSHIFLAHRIDITNSVIMIDIPAIDGMSVVQLADYVTMRAFARTKPISGDPAASTILNLFDPDPSAARPRALTDFDLAYLRAIYEGVDSLNAASKLASINRKLRNVEAEKTAPDAAK